MKPRLPVLFNLIVLGVFVLLGAACTDGVFKSRSTVTNASWVDPSFSPDGHKILFVWGSDTGQHLYLMNTDGSHRVQLTTTSSTDADPVFSPDGARVAFVSWRQDPDARQLNLINVDGADQRALTEEIIDPTGYHGLNAPFFSPDGQKVLFVSPTSKGSGTADALCSVNLNDNNKTRLIGPEQIVYPRPAFSPDGQTILYHTRNAQKYFDGTGPVRYEISIMRADGSSVTPIIEPAGNGSFSPNGRFIIFTYDPEPNPKRGFGAGPNREIYQIRPDGSGLAALTQSSPRGISYHSPYFSRDGSHIVFVRTRLESLKGFIEELCVMDADGSNLHTVTAFQETEIVWRGAFSSDGTEALFVTQRNFGASMTDYDVAMRMVRIIDGSNLRTLAEASTTK